MLAVLLLWLYISFTCIVIGVGALKLLSRYFAIQAGTLPLPEFIFVTGLSVLSALLSWASVFVAIDAVIHVILLVCILVTFAVCYSSVLEVFRSWLNWFKSLPVILKLMLGVIVLFILEKTSLPPMVYDTGLYHLQTMNWIEKFPAVPGLGNLHDRLAFNSGWFISAAFFRFSWLYGNGFYALNGLFFTMGTLLGFRGLTALYNKEIRLKWTISLLFLFSFLLFIKQLSSPSPDMPVTLLIWMVFMLYMARDNSEKDISLSDVLCLLLPVFIISLKFSALPVVFLSLYLLIRYLRIRKTAFVFKVILLMMLIIAPWMIRSVILSGYLLFPNTIIDIFNVDWKMPRETVKQTADAVIAWGRMPGFVPEFVLAKPMKEWLPLWFRGLFILDKVFLGAFILAFTGWIVMLIFRFSWVREYLSRNSRHVVMFCISIAGILFWFATAPDFRFVYGFFLLALVILLYPLYKYILEFLFRYNFSQRLVLATVLFLQFAIWWIYSFIIIYDRPIAKRVFLPAEPVKPWMLVAEPLGNTVVQVPFKDDRCWNTEIPCTWEVSPGLKMRGSKIEKGFKIQTE